MPCLYQIREKLQKESHEQQPDVHAIHIGIGGYYNVVVT